MKHIKNIAIYLTILALVEQSELHAVGGHGAPNIAGGNNIDHSSSHSAPTAAIGAAAYHSNQQSAMDGAGAGAAAGMMSGGGSSSGSGGSGGGSGSGSSTTPTTPALPTADAPNQQYSPGVNTGVPTTVNSSNSIAAQVATAAAAATPATPDATAAKKDEKDATTQLADELTAKRDEDTIVDEKELLDKINAISVHDEKIGMLLTQDSMKLLFNNFVYFKDFIVRNFTKEKMLSLAAEFIDQIYPVDKVKIINNTSVIPVSAPLQDHYDEDVMAEHSDQSGDEQQYDENQHIDHQTNDQDYAQQQEQYQHDDQTDQGQYAQEEYEQE